MIGRRADREPDPFATRRKSRARGRGGRLLVLGVLIALVGLGVYVVFFSGALALKKVVVTGNERVSARQVETAAGLNSGDSLASLDLAAAEARIVKRLVGVASVEASRCWPDEVCLEIRERAPIGVVSREGALFAIDAEGVLFLKLSDAEAGNREFRRMLRIEVADSAKGSALKEVAGVVSALPAEVRLKVAFVTASTIDEIGFELKSGSTVIWGSAEQTANKAKVLTALLQAQPEASQYDVSLPSNPTLRP